MVPLNASKPFLIARPDLGLISPFWNLKTNICINARSRPF